MCISRYFRGEITPFPIVVSQAIIKYTFFYTYELWRTRVTILNHLHRREIVKDITINYQITQNPNERSFT